MLHHARYCRYDQEPCRVNGQQVRWYKEVLHVAVVVMRFVLVMQRQQRCDSRFESIVDKVLLV